MQDLAAEFAAAEVFDELAANDGGRAGRRWVGGAHRLPQNTMAGCANSTRPRLVSVESTISRATLAATPVAIHHGRLKPRKAEVGVQAYSKNRAASPMPMA